MMESNVSSAVDGRGAGKQQRYEMAIINKQSVIELSGPHGATLACFVHCADNVDVKRRNDDVAKQNNRQFAARQRGATAWRDDDSAQPL
jgi:hypothetical protein